MKKVKIFTLSIIMSSSSFVNTMNMNHYYNNTTDHYFIQVPVPKKEEKLNPDSLKLFIKQKSYQYAFCHFFLVPIFYLLSVIVAVNIEEFFDMNQEEMQDLIKIFRGHTNKNRMNISVWIIINSIIPLIFIFKYKSHGFFKEYLVFIGSWLIGIIIPFLHFNLAKFEYNRHTYTLSTFLGFYLLLFVINLSLYFVYKYKGWENFLPIKNQLLLSNYQNKY